jgi:DNA modification methylase
MPRLPEAEIEKIISLLAEGKSLPEDYRDDLIRQLEQLKRSILFDTKKEYELVYSDKEREVDILADTMAVPLQKVKTFRNGTTGENDWTNMLVFGDNLQVLKTLFQMKEEGKLKNADGTPGIRLVYIDPPFATRQEFRGSQDQKAYQDKIAGTAFLEFLRKRLVFMHELLSDDGAIYVHLDWRKCHYIKAILDEIFGEANFQNEIIWQRLSARSDSHTYNHIHEVLYFYTKTPRFKFNVQHSEYSREYKEKFYRYRDPDGRVFSIGDLTARGLRNGESGKPWRGVDPSKLGNHWKVKISTLEELDREGKIFWPPSGKVPRLKQYLNERLGRPLQSIWVDISPVQFASAENANYPTQKPENLLKRVIKASTDIGDLVLDCFAGSGTTLAVAEKLGRRWIGVDSGKLAIYTMQKRLLNIAESRDLENPKRKYGKPYKPFTLYNAGLYDYKMIKELPWEKYREFSLSLFQCRDERHQIGRIDLDGYLGSDSVLVFNYEKHKNAVMGREFIDDLHINLGEKIGRHFFVIAPAASVRFLEDYIEKGKTRYFILRIPYSIIEEIHKKGFTKIRQPISENDVNDTVDAVGFDFIQIPAVECEYFITNKEGQLRQGEGTEDCVVRIGTFESKVISRKPLEYENLETLSMVMIDYDYNGDFFDLDDVYYAEDLKKDGYELRFDKGKVKHQMMIIYIDIFGNEKREIRTLADFSSRRTRRRA